MESESTNMEGRLKCLLIQLKTETGILERIIYKGKNQHRRCPYFQALIKVRRDLRLLQLADPGDILNVLFPIIDGRSRVEFDALPKRSNKKYLNGKHNYHNRLLGVARLLSEMVEPIIKAAIQISLLLAKTFFMGFSLTVLTCLARIRVLVQQGLIDVVSIFNEYAVLSQKHSLKLTLDGVESCVEYYSTRAISTLKCVWEDDKFVLHECTQSHSTEIQEKHGSFPSETCMQYQTLDVFNQVDQSAAIRCNTETVDCERAPTGENKEFIPSLRAGGIECESRKRVAFVAVQIPKSSETEPGQSQKKMRLDFTSITSSNFAAANAPDHPFHGISGGSLRSLF